MQQAIYNKIISEIAVSQKAAHQKTTTPAVSISSRLARRIAHQWDLWGVVALLGSCGAYALFAIAHVA